MSISMKYLPLQPENNAEVNEDYEIKGLSGSIPKSSVGFRGWVEKWQTIARTKSAACLLVTILVVLVYLFLHVTESMKAIHFIESKNEANYSGYRLAFYDNLRCRGLPIKEIHFDPDEPNKLYSTCNMNFSSMRLLDGPEANFYENCNDDSKYVGSLFEFERCTGKFSWSNFRSFRFLQWSSLGVKQIKTETMTTQWNLQDHSPELPANGVPELRIIYSSESSEYFGYQTWANYYGYLTSGQQSASWTRLLTASRNDDLSEINPGLATFHAKRSLHSSHYPPINKPDSIYKFLNSPDRPQERVIAVIDPDNWLIGDLTYFAQFVRPGQAIAQKAFNLLPNMLQECWTVICERNCETRVEPVAVPYLIETEDLLAIAPLWRYYTVKVKNLVDTDDYFSREFKKLQIDWTAEMIAYAMAAAHVGISHKTIRYLQIRDTDQNYLKEMEENVPLLHIGRAFFRQGDPMASQWNSTEEKFASLGEQVWCKCNTTAGKIWPWPYPEDIDFVSRKTLDFLHYSEERFGKIPENETFRRKESSKYLVAVR